MTKTTKTPTSEKKVDKKTDEYKIDLSLADANLLDLDKNLKIELKQKKLVPKFINNTKLRGNHMSTNMWIPYKRESQPEGAAKFIFGTTAEGYTIRGDLILAVRDEQFNNKKKADLKKKRDAYNNYANGSKMHQSSLKKHFNEAHIDNQIIGDEEAFEE